MSCSFAPLVVWVRGWTSLLFRTYNGLCVFPAGLQPETCHWPFIVLKKKKSLAITCLYAKDEIIIKFNSYRIMTILCRLRPRMKSPIQDGIGPIPHSLALYSEWIDCLSYLYFPSRSKIRKMKECILSLQI